MRVLVRSAAILFEEPTTICEWTDVRGCALREKARPMTQAAFHDLSVRCRGGDARCPGADLQGLTSPYAEVWRAAEAAAAQLRDRAQPRRSGRDLPREAHRDRLRDLRRLCGGRNVRADQPRPQAAAGRAYPRRQRRTHPGDIGRPPRPARGHVAGHGRRGRDRRRRERRNPVDGISVHGWDAGSGCRRSVRRLAARSMSTRPRSSTRPGAPASPRVSCSATATSSSGAESVSAYLGNTADDVILSVLPLSFDAGLSQVTTAFAVGAHCVLMNYLLPREVAKLCERHGVTGLTCVPPLWLQLADVPWPRSRSQAASVLRQHRWTVCRAPRSTASAAIFTEADAVSHVRPHRGIPIHLSRPVRGRPSAGFDRQGDPERRDPRAAPGRDPVRPGRAGRARSSRRACRARLLERPGRTAERYRPIVRPARGGARRRWQCGQATRSWQTKKASSTSSAVRDDMIKTSGYRVSPTEIEEAAYSTGLVRDAVAVGVEDARSRPADRSGRDPCGESGWTRRTHDGPSSRLAALHGPATHDRCPATSCPAPRTASSTAPDQS